MDDQDIPGELTRVLFTADDIDHQVRAIAARIERDYHGQELLLVGILRGSIHFMADLTRVLRRHVEIDWMDISSYGSGTKSSGVVRLLKDLDSDITGRNVLLVDEIVDSGLTLSWIRSSLLARGPASVEICTLLRKPEAQTMPVTARYVGWDIPDEFVVGYGLDFAERYRNLRCIGVLSPSVYA